MEIKKYAFLIMIMTGLLLAACGTSGQTKEDVEISSYDWQTKGFTLGDSSAGSTQAAPALSDDTPLFPVDYKDIEYITPGNGGTSIASYVTSNGIIFVLDIYYMENSESYVVQNVDAEGNIQPSFVVAPDMWGFTDGIIESMDVLSSEQYVFWVASDIWEDEKGHRYAGHFYAIYTDADGKEQRRTDIIDFLRAQKIWERYGSAISYMGREISCDSQGNIYIYDWEKHAMYLLNPEGEFLTSYTYQTKVDNFIHSFRADSGEEILVCESDRGTEFIWLDPESRQPKQLATAEKFDFVKKWYGLWGDTLYYTTQSQVIGWNVSTGEKQVLVNMGENEIRNADMTFFLKTASGAQLLATEGGKRYLMTFSTEKPEIQGRLQVINLVQKDDFLKGRVATFSRENPLCGIEYVESYDESNVARVLMEMANGKGPAIAYISREDMENLGSKGALADLNGILIEENLEALLPGVIELGTYGGELYGLPLVIDSIDTVCIGSTYFQGDTWTIGDVLTVLEEHSELEGLFANGEVNYFQNMAVLLCKDLEHSPYIENGKAKFNSKEFQELLETVKARGNSEEILPTSVSEDYELIREGKILGSRDGWFNMHGFCYQKEMQGDDCYYVGFPTETGKGTYLVAERGVLVVNQNAAEQEEIGQLLNYLFSLESQQMVRNSISVRMDVPETLVSYNEFWEQYVVEYFDGSNQKYLLDNYDESYLEEYLHLLKTAVPRPVGSDKLFDIIWEEAEAYFYSDKSVEAVCDAIQSRVQLYLDEQ